MSGFKTQCGALSHEAKCEAKLHHYGSDDFFFLFSFVVVFFSLISRRTFAPGALLHFGEAAAAERLVGRQGERQACGRGKCTCTVHFLPLPLSLPLPPSLPDSFPKWSWSMASWSGSPGIV